MIFSNKSFRELFEDPLCSTNFVPFTMDLWVFYFLAITSRSAVSIHVQVFACSHMLPFLSVNIQEWNGWAICWVCAQCFKKLASYLAKWLYHFTSPRIGNASSICSTELPFVQTVFYFYMSRRRMDAEHLLVCLLAISIFSVWFFFPNLFAHSLIWLSDILLNAAAINRSPLMSSCDFLF